jgi:hypothetical protein
MTVERVSELPAGLPEEVYTFGPPEAVFTGKRYGPVQRLVETAIVAALLLGVGYWVFLQYERFLQEDGFYPRGLQVFQLLLILFPIAIVLGEVFGKPSRIALHTAIVYPDRLVCIAKQGSPWTFFTYTRGQLFEKPGKVKVLQWNKIVRVRQEASVVPGWLRPKLQHRFTLSTRRGREIVLQGDFSLYEDDMVVLGGRIQKEVTALLLPSAEREFHAGHTLNFGTLSAHRSGLRTRDGEIAWQAISRVKVDRGEISVTPAGPHAGAPRTVARVGEVDNLYVLLGLMKETVGIPVEMGSLAPTPSAAVITPSRRRHVVVVPPIPVLFVILIALYAGAFGGLSRWFYLVNGAELSRDGLRLYLGCDDGSVRVWDTESGRVVAVLHGHGARVDCVAASPDGRHLASGSGDWRIHIWDLDTGEPVLTLKGHQGEIRSLAYSPDGRRLASGSEDHSVRIWDTESGQELRMLHEQTSRVWSLAFHPDGRQLASAAWRSARTERALESKVIVWDTETGRVKFAIPDAEDSVAYTPEGDRLLAGGKEGKVYDARTGKELATLKGHPHPVKQVAVSRDGKRFASLSTSTNKGGSSSTLKIWDGGGLAELHSHRFPGSLERRIAFTPDGTALVTVNYSGEIRKVHTDGAAPVPAKQ